jgi:hypothetical protein
VARRVAAAVLALAVLLGAQAAADALAPAGRSSAGGAIGRSGFAYLTGIRTFAAAVLWARLEPVNDTYYQTTTLGQKKFLLPSVRMVTLLDPQLQEAYYVGQFVLLEAGLKDGAEQLAAEGVAKNPDSAYLHASYAQLLIAEGRFHDAARQADLAAAGKWPTVADEWDALPALEIAFDKTGQKAKADAVRRERRRLEELGKQRPGILQHPEG